ncbi:hypothetical protein [Sanguibacter suaedae]|uniref:PH domain-containing protein n=1 Tax=Sanguibacter suaedae TaxID=2795737 RepID=A0A934MC13_9MICO|nr:hypothetical protein [Sanguibacter suaedae]MBI9113444.1 hypothetical protein [Sanguibacter suaedae]
MLTRSPSVQSRPLAVDAPVVVLRPLWVRASLTVLLLTFPALLVRAVVDPGAFGEGLTGILQRVLATGLALTAVVLALGLWRARLTVTPTSVTRLPAFADTRSVTFADAARVQVAPLLDATRDNPGALPTVTVTSRTGLRITSRPDRREVDVLLARLARWTTERPELVKDAHTERFLAAYRRSTRLGSGTTLLRAIPVGRTVVAGTGVDATEVSA